MQGIAAEKIDFLQLREQAGTRVAARGALHLLDGQRLANIQPIRVKLGAVIEMTRDEKNIAADILAASRCQPIGATALHQLDKLKIVLGQTPAKYFLFVGRVDCDRAYRFLVGAHLMSPRGDQQGSQQGKFQGSRHAEVLARKRALVLHGYRALEQGSGPDGWNRPETTCGRCTRDTPCGLLRRKGVRAPCRRIPAQKSRRAFRAEEKLLRSQGDG